MKTALHIVCWAAWLCPGLLIAQSGKAGAQPSAMEKAKVDSLNDLSFFTEDSESAWKYALEAQTLAIKSNYPKGLGDSYTRLGQAAFATQNWEKCEQYHRKALAERVIIGLAPEIASCYNELGKLYQALGKSDSAVALFCKGLSLMKDQPVHINTIVLNSNLGHLYRLTGKYELAGRHLEAAMHLYPTLMLHPPMDYTRDQLEFKLASVRLDLAEFLQSALHQYPAAKDSLFKSLVTFRAQNKKGAVAKCLLLLGNNAYFNNRLEEALACYEEGIAFGDQINKVDLYTLIRNRGRIYLDQNKYKKALRDFRTSLAAFEQDNNRQQLAATQSEIGNLYYELSEADSAIYHYRLALSQDIQDPMLKGRLLYFLADILFQAGKETESQEYTRLYIKHLEGLNGEQMRGAFAQMNWQFVDKNRLLRRVVGQEKQTQFRYGLLGLGVLTLLLFLALLSARLQRQKRRLAEQNAEIARQQEQILLQKNLDLLKNKELENNYARLAGQDEMQRKIGQELHDGVGAMLASVKLNLSPVDEVLDYLPENNRQQYATANRLLGEASEEVRRISHALSSAVLQKFGLKAQLEALAEIIPGSGKLQVELVTHGLKERLDYKTEFHIYRMVQELVHNVVKHAQAQNITIQVNRFEHAINVIVEDDGRGFELEKIREHPGIGMQNLAARVHDLHGEMQIDSRPGRGTMVSIDIPLNA